MRGGPHCSMAHENKPPADIKDKMGGTSHGYINIFA